MGERGAGKGEGEGGSGRVGRARVELPSAALCSGSASVVDAVWKSPVIVRCTFAAQL